jgi:hypothetical protein
MMKSMSGGMLGKKMGKFKLPFPGDLGGLFGR